MLTHWLIWDFWMTRTRTRTDRTRFYAGHTPSEQEAFDRLMARRRTTA